MRRNNEPTERQEVASVVKEYKITPFAMFAIFGMIIGLLFLSFRVTGNVIGLNQTASSWIGGAMFIIGVVAFFIYLKNK